MQPRLYSVLASPNCLCYKTDIGSCKCEPQLCPITSLVSKYVNQSLNDQPSPASADLRC